MSKTKINLVNCNFSGNDYGIISNGSIEIVMSNVGFDKNSYSAISVPEGSEIIADNVGISGSEKAIDIKSIESAELTLRQYINNLNQQQIDEILNIINENKNDAKFHENTTESINKISPHIATLIGIMLSKGADITQILSYFLPK